MWRRRRRSVCLSRPAISSPLKRTEPAVGSIRRSTRRPVVDLPQPDSPTSASVSPRAISKLTSSTARTSPTSLRRTTPRVIGKCFTRPSTCRTGLRIVSLMPPSSTGAFQQATLMARPDVAQRRRLGGAAPVGERAARREAAALGLAVGAGHRALDGREPLAVDVEARDRAQQADRVGVLRIGEQRRDRRALDDLAGVHHHHVVGELGDHAEIVGDDQHRHAEALAAGRCSSSRICAWMVTSSAVVGSSAISSAGSHDSAMAIITRWRMPPERWCG